MVVLEVTDGNDLMRSMPSLRSANFVPYALLIPVGRTITAVLLKVILSSKPSSRMIRSILSWFGTCVARITFPISSGAISLHSAQKSIRQGIGQQRRFPAPRFVKERPVLGHYVAKQVDIRADRQEIIQLSPVAMIACRPDVRNLSRPSATTLDIAPPVASVPS